MDRMFKKEDVVKHPDQNRTGEEETLTLERLFDRGFVWSQYLAGAREKVAYPALEPEKTVFADEDFWLSIGEDFVFVEKGGAVTLRDNGKLSNVFTCVESHAYLAKLNVPEDADFYTLQDAGRAAFKKRQKEFRSFKKGLGLHPGAVEVRLADFDKEESGELICSLEDWDWTTDGLWLQKYFGPDEDAVLAVKAMVFYQETFVFEEGNRHVHYGAGSALILDGEDRVEWISKDRLQDYFVLPTSPLNSYAAAREDGRQIVFAMQNGERPNPRVIRELSEAFSDESSLSDDGFWDGLDTL